MQDMSEANAVVINTAVTGMTVAAGAPDSREVERC